MFEWTDDFVQPPFLYMLYNFLKFNPKYVGVSCDYFITNNEERVSTKFKSNYIACGLMFRTSYLETIESYNKSKEYLRIKTFFDK